MCLCGIDGVSLSGVYAVFTLFCVYKLAFAAKSFIPVDNFLNTSSQCSQHESAPDMQVTTS